MQGFPAVVVLALACAAIVWMNLAAWRAWHDRTTFESFATPGAWRHGHRLSRGLTRGIAVFAAAWDWLLLAGIAHTLTDGLPSGPQSHLLALLFLGGLFACVVAMASITLVNRPRWLVVPHQRHLRRTDLGPDAALARRRFP